MQTLDAYQSTENLEAFLGNPTDPASRFSFARSVQLDEESAYPTELRRALEDWGYHHHCVPVVEGGVFSSFEEYLSLNRAVCRRDLTVGVECGVSVLGMLPAWVSGTARQKQIVCQRTLNAAYCALALTERAHGTDLLNCETSAQATESGFILRGEKWLVNAATRSQCVTVFARTNPAGGARGFSFFLFEKDKVDDKTFSHVPGVKTLGLRASDISGIRFESTALARDALIGQQGQGLEIASSVFQIERALCTPYSLGAADLGLRCVLDFALGRSIYGSNVFSLGHPRRLIVNAFVDLIISEIVSIVSARALHTNPEQMSLIASVAKFFVPLRVENIVRALTQVFGARFFVRGEHWDGAFQKMFRDVQAVAFFGGNLASNLERIALQLNQLHSPNARVSIEERKTSLGSLFSLDQKLPPFDFKRLELTCRGRDDVTQGLELALAQLEEQRSDARSARVAESASGHLQRLRSHLTSFPNRLQALQDELRQDWIRSPESFELAREHATAFAALSCVHLWLNSRGVLDSFFHRGEWLEVALHRLMGELGLSAPPPPRAIYENIGAELVERFSRGQLASIIPIALSFQPAPTRSL